MSKRRILVQLDSDQQASVFDGVVAVDAGVDHLFRHHSVSVDQVEGLVHGTIFTRGVDDLSSTAIFVGSSNVADGEELLAAVKSTFFGPMRVSVMMDSNGANTTAAAAVLSASKHVDLSQAKAAVLAATGPVGQRAARLLAGQGAAVRLVSRSLDRAAQATEAVRSICTDADLEPRAASTSEQAYEAVSGCDIIISAGAAGIELLADEHRTQLTATKVAIDLNAVPPLGLGGIEVFDSAVERDGMHCYGAVGVGGLKMKIHKAALRSLYESNDQVLDAEEIFEIGINLLD